MPSSVLGPNNWRVQEGTRGNDIAREAEDIQQWEVRCQALSSPASNVEDYLRIKGQGPGGEV